MLCLCIERSTPHFSSNSPKYSPRGLSHYELPAISLRNSLGTVPPYVSMLTSMTLAGRRILLGVRTCEGCSIPLLTLDSLHGEISLQPGGLVLSASTRGEATSSAIRRGGWAVECRVFFVSLVPCQMDVTLSGRGCSQMDTFSGASVRRREIPSNNPRPRIETLGVVSKIMTRRSAACNSKALPNR